MPFCTFFCLFLHFPFFFGLCSFDLMMLFFCSMALVAQSFGVFFCREPVYNVDASTRFCLRFSPSRCSFTSRIKTKTLVE